MAVQIERRPVPAPRRPQPARLPVRTAAATLRVLIGHMKRDGLPEVYVWMAQDALTEIESGAAAIEAINRAEAKLAADRVERERYREVYR